VKIEELFDLKEIIYFLFYFPLPILWIFVIALFFVSKEKKIFAFKIVLFLFYFCLTSFFASLLEYPLIRGDNFNYDNERYSAVLVPTAGIYKDVNSTWHPSSNSVLRVKLGEKIAKKYNLPLVISGGKIDLQGDSEAETILEIVNYKNTIVENISRNTYETSKNLSNVFKKNNFDKDLTILLVTSPRHSLRTSLALKKQGFRVKSYIMKKKNRITFHSFLPDSRTISLNNASIYEYIGIIYYFIRGYI